MLNQIVLVGRIKEFKGNNLLLAIPKSFKNTKGVYETDYVEIKLWGNISQNTKEYCTKGDLIGIKGRVETGNKIIAEKVTFLSSKRKED